MVVEVPYGPKGGTMLMTVGVTKKILAKSQKIKNKKQRRGAKVRENKGWKVTKNERSRKTGANYKRMEESGNKPGKRGGGMLGKRRIKR